MGRNMRYCNALPVRRSAEKAKKERKTTLTKTKPVSLRFAAKQLIKKNLQKLNLFRCASLRFAAKQLITKLKKTFTTTRNS